MPLFISLLIILAVLSTKISSRLGLPLLIGFILIGIVAGSDVLNLFYFDDARLTKKIADILLIFIIFEGGFRVTKDSFRSVAAPALSLATLGVAVTALVLGLMIHWVFKFDFVYSLIISSIISSTDAAAVFMVTKSNPIRAKLASTLNIESAANDPMAILLTVVFIQVASKALSSPVVSVLLLLWQFTGGFLLGFLCYRASLLVFNLLRSFNRGNYNVLLLGCILFAFGIADLAGANGIIAVFFMGYWLGNSNFPAKRSVSNFLESVTTIFNILLFIMLGLLAFPTRFIHIWKEALAIVAMMMFVARPLAVLLSTLPFKYGARERIFLMWGGVKGAVPIVLATYPAASGMDADGFIFDTIFFAVFVSCLLQGTTLGRLSKLFRFTEKKKPDSAHIIELHSLKTSDIEMFELHIDVESLCVDSTLAELNLGNNVLVSSIVREGQLLLPKGRTAVKGGDILYVLAPSDQISEISARLNSVRQEEPS